MTDPLDRVLQLVAEGKLSAEDAAPILAALDQRSRPDPAAAASPAMETGTGQAATANPRFARVEVRERGKRVVDLRVPISLGRFALSRVPGLSSQQIADVDLEEPQQVAHRMAAQVHERERLGEQRAFASPLRHQRVGRR